MNFKKQFNKIREALTPLEKIWSTETIEQDIDQWPEKPLLWLKELSNLSHYELWKISNKQVSKELTETHVGRHILELKDLVYVPSLNHSTHIELPSWAFQKVKLKKQHEISVLSQCLAEIKIKTKAQNLIDIGAGQGHFSRVMAHYFHWPTLSIERDIKLQELGRARLKKHPAPQGAAEMTFEQLDFQGPQSQGPQVEKLKGIFRPESFSLGLHTCGPLAVRHLETQNVYQTKGLLNFGCCYGKLNDPKDLNLSQEAQKAPLLFKTKALNLAARSHSKISYPEFCLLERVKSYRYGLELYLQATRPNLSLSSVGDSPSRDYLQTFESYALDKLNYLNADIHQNEIEKLRSFYRNPRTQSKLHKLFCADIIRWVHGRVLELYILLDRALYLEEQNHHVEISAYFDESLSPRNIGLLVYRD